jgi:hypothetical protein
MPETFVIISDYSLPLCYYKLPVLRDAKDKCQHDVSFLIA